MVHLELCLASYCLSFPVSSCSPDLHDNMCTKICLSSSVLYRSLTSISILGSDRSVSWWASCAKSDCFKSNSPHLMLINCPCEMENLDGTHEHWHSKSWIKGGVEGGMSSVRKALWVVALRCCKNREAGYPISEICYRCQTNGYHGQWEGVGYLLGSSRFAWLQKASYIWKSWSAPCPSTDSRTGTQGWWCPCWYPPLQQCGAHRLWAGSLESSRSKHLSRYIFACTLSACLLPCRILSARWKTSQTTAGLCHLISDRSCITIAMPVWQFCPEKVLGLLPLESISYKFLLVNISI